jgi:hypothetical protein
VEVSLGTNTNTFVPDKYHGHGSSPVHEYVLSPNTVTITSHEHAPLPLLSDPGHTDARVMVRPIRIRTVFFRIIFFQNCSLLDSNPSRVRLG